MEEEYDPLYPNDYERIKKGEKVRTEPAHPSPPTRNPVDSRIGEKLLKRMGWTEGSGLGKDQQGITEPIVAAGRANRSKVGVMDKHRVSNS